MQKIWSLFCLFQSLARKTAFSLSYTEEDGKEVFSGTCRRVGKWIILKFGVKQKTHTAFACFQANCDTRYASLPCPLAHTEDWEEGMGLYWAKIVSGCYWANLKFVVSYSQPANLMKCCSKSTGRKSCISSVRQKLFLLVDLLRERGKVFKLGFFLPAKPVILCRTFSGTHKFNCMILNRVSTFQNNCTVDLV